MNDNELLRRFENLSLPTPNADAFCDTHPQIMTKHNLRLFYMRERHMQLNAKTEFVAPDLTSLPSVVR